MGRRRTHTPLNVYLNNRYAGRLSKGTGGSIEFIYAPSWLAWEHAMPVSLSLPLREDRYTGATVSAVFENLLPDSDAIRKRIAERVGAVGIDAYSLLTCIGHDCVGALQFLPDGYEPETSGVISGNHITPVDIENILKNLGRSPLGLEADDDFRISIAGAQEKTALLFYEGRWWKPTGTTPTTHILKPQIGHLPNGIDLSNSVENEFYCLKLMEGFGFKVNKATIQIFGDKKSLVIERFDRKWTKDRRLLRLPQEDCCQALSTPPTLKYQNQGGPGIVDIMKLLRGGDEPLVDQLLFLKSQIVFWLIGATDAHAKNFSIHLMPGGHYRLTPFYDILTAQPSLDAHQIQRKQMKLTMSVGQSRHYKIFDVQKRHFVQTGEQAGLSKIILQQTIEEVLATTDKAFQYVEVELPKDFPEWIHASVKKAAYERLQKFKVAS